VTAANHLGGFVFPAQRASRPIPYSSVKHRLMRHLLGARVEAAVAGGHLGGHLTPPRLEQALVDGAARAGTDEGGPEHVPALDRDQGTTRLSSDEGARVGQPTAGSAGRLWRPWMNTLLGHCRPAEDDRPAPGRVTVSGRLPGCAGMTRVQTSPSARRLLDPRVHR